MNLHDATEQAFTNGYSAGYEAGRRSAVGGDVTSVVRCKNCKHWKNVLPDCTEHKKFCEIGLYLVEENGYCSFGEKKAQSERA